MSFIDLIRERAERPVLAPTVKRRERKERSVRDVVAVLRSNLDINIYSQSRLKNIILAGLAGRLNVLIVSPPGEAKTLAVDTLAASIPVKYYSRLLTADTTSFDVIGYPVTRETMSTNEKRIEVDIDPSTGAFDAKIVLFDEVFKPPGTVLVYLYDLLAKRMISFKSKHIPAKTWVVYGLSNPGEVEEKVEAGDPSFLPLLDRFDVRVWLSRTPVHEYEAILDTVYRRKTDPSKVAVLEKVTEDEVVALQRHVDELIKRNYRYYRALVVTVAEAAVDAGFDVSPRQAVNLVRLVASLDAVGVTGKAVKVSYIVSSLASTPTEVSVIGEKVAKKLNLDAYMEIERAIEEVEKSISQKNFGIALDMIEKAKALASGLEPEEGLFHKWRQAEPLSILALMIPR